MNEIYKQIAEVAKKLPNLPKKPKKNFFDIIGVQGRETINSQLLRYFFDPKEEHGFDTLFFDALLFLLNEKSKEKDIFKKFSGSFKVETEVSTLWANAIEDRLKRIDILISGEGWCIIIENKLYHHLKNPLEAYYQHAKNVKNLKDDNIVGIVLSLNFISKDECAQNDIVFFNITHQELIEKVQQNLILSHVENDIDIFYLREYAKTINSHYTNKMNEPQVNNLLSSFIEQKEAVNDIVEKRENTLKYLVALIIEVFDERGYKYNDPWYCHPKNENLCFSVTPAEEILSSNKIEVAFELWNDLLQEVGTETIGQIHEVIKIKMNQSSELQFIQIPIRQRMKRIVTYKKDNFLSASGNFKEELEAVLDNYFFKHGGIQDIVLGYLPDYLKL